MSDLVDRLNEEARRLSGRSLDRGCADSGIASNLADEAASRIESIEAEYHEERRARYAAQSECVYLASQIEDHKKWIGHLEAGLKAARLVNGRESPIGMAITDLLDSKPLSSQPQPQPTPSKQEKM
jgi:hypothetical protein